MKTKRFDLNFKPLIVTMSHHVVSSVPAEQTYDAVTGEYTPDYTSVPLTFQVDATVLDKDEYIEGGNINASLINVTWSANGETILATDSNYVIGTGEDIGQIQVKRNVEPAKPLQLMFSAEYIDPRNKQIIRITQVMAVRCEAESSVVRIETDAADTNVYNPFTDVNKQLVTPRVWVGDALADASTYKLRYETSTTDGWREIDSTNPLDVDKFINEDGSVTVDRWLMGESTSMRIRVAYSRTGDLDSVEFTDASPFVIISWQRRLPAYEYDYDSVPTDLPVDSPYIKPKAKVTTSAGDLDNFAHVLTPVWYAADNAGRPTLLDYTEVARGVNPTIDLTSYITSEDGAVVAIDMEEVAPAGPWADSDGAVLTDADGAILII